MEVLLGIVIGLVVGNFFGAKGVKNKVMEYLMEEHQKVKVAIDDIKTNEKVMESTDESDETAEKKLNVIMKSSEMLGKLEFMKDVAKLL